MPRDHFLPASLIGRFSSENAGPARKRKVYVLHRGRRVPSLTRAENIGFVNDLYQVSVSFWGDTSASVDPALHGYEPELPPALNQLEQVAPIDLSVWLGTLVPYVAAIFVRGHDFIPRYLARPSVLSAGLPNAAEHANIARGVELERLLAPVCCARWVVLHKDAGEPFVLNDLGVTAMVNGRSGEHGWATPIGKNSLLGIFPARRRAVAFYENGAWRAIIEHSWLDGSKAAGYNGFTARHATSFVVAPEPATLERIAPIVADYGDARALMERWPIDPRTLRAHAREWHRLLSVAVNNPSPDDLTDLQRVDLNALAMRWYPPVGVLINMRDFPTGLKRVGNVIWLSLDTPMNYGDYLIRPRTA